MTNLRRCHKWSNRICALGCTLPSCASTFRKTAGWPWFPPRQVGKTTSCREIGTAYLNWDNSEDRRLLLRAPAALADSLELQRLQARPPVVVLDELHKYPKWKTLLKVFFDTYGASVRLIVTGSSRLEVFRSGSDRLMERYLLYRMHPWSACEPRFRNGRYDRRPQSPPQTGARFGNGGIPEPFLRREHRFTRRWRSLRQQQLTREDLREVAHVSDLCLGIADMRVLYKLYTRRKGGPACHHFSSTSMAKAAGELSSWSSVW